ncbi:hypothetical protein KR51_00025460 [Rubidibacter lacunae KORDI 51-2]|uniref:Uncharacterized protein n=1 Tax=Rubidibacter lacunae KORDI 51-2 TaxID=582515 RepID=U5DH61_9CHRO|nr:hypothetical protein [Rubidibacter lacunae]ERN40936.1 hypothetical protein KR51_00025460 [Rubidibacter lacunae KORDI 51-2]
MDPSLFVLIAAVIVVWLVFAGLVRIVKTSVATALKIALVLLVAQLVFAIAPLEIGQRILQLPNDLWEMWLERG